MDHMLKKQMMQTTIDPGVDLTASMKSEVSLPVRVPPDPDRPDPRSSLAKRTKCDMAHEKMKTQWIPKLTRKK